MHNNTIVEVDNISIEHTEELVDVYNFEVENAHTYYVTDRGILVHNSCRSTQRKKYWKKEAIEQKGAGKTYDIDVNGNLNRMQKGKTPIGYDGKKVELHHVEGIKNSFENVVQIQRTDYIRFHKLFGYRSFPNITTIKDIIFTFIK